MFRSILNAINIGANKTSHENQDQNSTYLVNKILNFVIPSADMMDFEFTEQQTKENISWPYWQSLPQPLKANVASFLNRREVTMLSKINREENENKILFLCASLARDPDQIKTIDDLTMFIAQLLKLRHKDISGSERFETLMIKFIQKLEPQQTTFLTPDMDITNQAHYNFVQVNGRIAFQYKKLNKDENIAMAQVLEQYFPGANLRVVQIEKNDPYYISIDKKVFLQHILPWFFKNEGKPQKKTQIHEPEVIDYIPTDSSQKKRYYVTRKDGKPLTAEDKEEIYSSVYLKRL